MHAKLEDFLRKQSYTYSGHLLHIAKIWTVLEI